MTTRSHYSNGFTLVELVMVIILLGILSAVVMPKFFGRSDFDTRVMFDDTLGAIRYAHKQAVATGCNTQIRFHSDNYAVFRDDSCTSGNFVNNSAVRHPTTGEVAYSGSQNNISITATHATSTFNALGTADKDNVITIGRYSITIIAATGFSYDSTP